MIDKLPITYPAFPLGPIEQDGPRPVVARQKRRSGAADRYRQIVKVTATVLIAAILALTFVLSSQGIGLEYHAGPGPDRPPQPIHGAPVPQPDWG
jgi:hypothetical protein